MVLIQAKDRLNQTCFQKYVIVEASEILEMKKEGYRDKHQSFIKVGFL